METTVARSIHAADLFSYIHPQKANMQWMDMDGMVKVVYFKAASRTHISTIHPAELGSRDGNGRIHWDHRE